MKDWNKIIPLVAKAAQHAANNSFEDWDQSIGESLRSCTPSIVMQELREYEKFARIEGYDFTLSDIPKHTLSMDGQDDLIDGIALNPKIKDEELHEFYIIDREDYIENLIMWINEAKNDGSKALMLQDLKMLLGWEDDYILTSNETNDFINSEDPRFDKVCEELLELNEKLAE